MHGCYVVHARGTSRTVDPSASPFRMQAAALGVYLLYGRDGTYLVDAGSGSLANASAPSQAAEWRASGSGAHGFMLTNLSTGTRLPVSFVAAKGCAVYPEAQVDASGRGFRGTTPEGSVLGTVEGHAHITAFEFFGGDWHCGRPWSPYGAPYALPASCADDEQGTNGEVETFLDFGGATRPSDMHGWPTFVRWPSPTALAEEGDYYTGIERAWKAGLRVMVTNLVDNQALCQIMTKRHNPCLDMADVQIQSRDLYALQDYIDAQSGGPGRGWFRIVTNPFQARRVISQGKLAVIEGIEMSELFGCGEYDDQPQCDQAQVDAGLRQVLKLGVRTFFPVHEFNNAFGGSKMIAGDTGAIINAGNREETGSFFTLQPCPARDQDAEQISFAPAGPLAGVLNGPAAGLLHGNPLPVYQSGPQCNTRGLTDLGAYLIRQMIAHHVIIQLDHMDSKTATAALKIASAAHYAGVVSAHCCSSPQLFQGVYATGGFVTPPVEEAPAFVATWKSDKAVRDRRFHFGFGYGSDENGLAEQPGPLPSIHVDYPFRSFAGGVTFTREQWGQRRFDLNTDGLSNYGMYADWLHQLQLAGGRALMSDMFQGAEAYLEMWERADGVPATRCRPAAERFGAQGLGRSLRLGESYVKALYSAGQPSSRPGDSYRYCVRGGGRVAAVFDRRGRVAALFSNARRDRADAVRPGQRSEVLRGVARRAGRGLWLGRSVLRGGRQFVYGVRAGRVSFVGVVLRGTRLARAVTAAGL